MIEIDLIPPGKAEELCRRITKDLPEYFGLPECNKAYAMGVRSRHNLAAKIDNHYVGLISLDFPYPNNGNIYWMAVLRRYQKQGVGHELVDAACRLAKEKGANTITVESLSPQEADENYLKTYQFYLSTGFQPLLNLKPQSHEWKMVYMAKYLDQIHPHKLHKPISIRPFRDFDIPLLVAHFAEHHWPKPPSTFEQYLQEQQTGERFTWIAYLKDQLAGYATLVLQSRYQPFCDNHIPEIMDLNVLPPFRNHGVGSKLLEAAENAARIKSSIVGIGVGLYEGYGAAQKLYIKHGYLPDGRGISYNDRLLVFGDSVVLDDDLVLRFTKKLI